MPSEQPPRQARPIQPSNYLDKDVCDPLSEIYLHSFYFSTLNGNTPVTLQPRRISTMPRPMIHNHCDQQEENFFFDFEAREREREKEGKDSVKMVDTSPQFRRTLQTTSIQTTSSTSHHSHHYDTKGEHNLVTKIYFVFAATSLLCASELVPTALIDEIKSNGPNPGPGLQCTSDR